VHTPKYRYTYATKKIVNVPLRRGVRLIWLNSSKGKGGKILIHFFHNHVRNKVKSPHAGGGSSSDDGGSGDGRCGSSCGGLPRQWRWQGRGCGGGGGGSGVVVAVVVVVAKAVVIARAVARAWQGRGKGAGGGCGIGGYRSPVVVSWGGCSGGGGGNAAVKSVAVSVASLVAVAAGGVEGFNINLKSDREKIYLINSTNYFIFLPLLRLTTMVLRFPRMSCLSHLPSIIPSVAAAFIWLVVVYIHRTAGI
jgi:hypothetical protein